MFSTKYLNIRKFVSVVFVFAVVVSTVAPAMPVFAEETAPEMVVESTVSETSTEETSSTLETTNNDQSELTTDESVTEETSEETEVESTEESSSFSASALSVSNYVPNFSHNCLLPNSLGDNTVEPVVHGWDTYSLQDIFNQKSISKNVINDQKQHQVWDTNKTDTNIKVELLSKNSVLNATFGYYKAGNTSSFIPLFNSASQASSYSTTTTVSGIGQYGFAIKVSSGDFWATQNSLNGGNDYAVVYESGADEYIIAFEDLPLNSSDKDWNDIIVKVTVTGCSNNTNTPPTITLTGNNPLTITQNSTFTDPGATATDLEDGNLTSSIVITGTVSTTTVGTSTLTYTVTDSGGLSASTTRTVVVKSNGGNPNPVNTPPQITLIGQNPITIVVGNTFTDSGATATDTEDGNLTSAIVVTGSVSTSTVSTSTLTYTVTDSGGLSASTTRTVIVATSTTPTNPPTGGTHQCSDGIDNDGDDREDIEDPGCHSDNDPTNTTSYNPNDDDETNQNGGGGGGGGRRHPPVTGEVLGTSICSYLRDYLKIGWNNDKVEVLKLQSFLNVFEGHNVQLTGVFDEQTFSAVEVFQNKYKSDILTPWGHTAPTGFVYILTKKKVNEIYCKAMIALNQADQNEIDAFRAFLQANPGTTIDKGQNVGSGTSTEGDSQNGVSYSTGNAGISNSSDQEDVVKDNENSASSTISNGVVRNAAVSLFGATEKIFNDGKYTALFLILFILLIILLRWLFSLKDSDGDDSQGPTSENTEAEIFLGAEAKKESQDLLPEDEIIIEDDTIDNLPVFGDSEEEDKTN